ncbi:MAG: alpha-2-macroglobulin [Treponema sp.]|nr:alpha-2-macroglobulin [Treponema sp.]
MNFKKLILPLLAAACLVSGGCNKFAKAPKSAFFSDSNKSQNAVKRTNASFSETSMNYTMDSTGVVNFNSLTDFFTLDYSSEKPDEPIEETEAEKSSKKSKKKNEVPKQTESVIPGIRPLSDYSIQYNPEYKDPPKARDVFIPSDPKDKTEFKIDTWGPQQSIVASNDAPSFYVLFNKPAKPLTALEAPSETSDIMTVTPPLKGVFRWYGTQHLSFEASEAADPSIVYTIKINPETKSSSGQKITGQLEFKTQAEPLKIQNLWGGYVKDNTTQSNYSSGTLPPYENRFLIRLNYPVTIETLNKKLLVKVGSQEVSFKAEPDYTDKAFYWYYTPRSDESKKITNTYIVTINDDVPHNTTVFTSIRDGKGGSFSYSTLKPFKLERVANMTSYSYGKTKDPLRVEFTQIPDKASLIKNISFNFDYELKEENIIIEGTDILVCNLPLQLDTVYSIKFGDGIKDVYGQPCNMSQKEYSFRTRAPLSYVKYIDYGTKMLEAQFPHKILFEYQNILPGSYYETYKIDNPLYRPSKTRLETSTSEATVLEPGERNRRQFKEINLDPYLEDGYGFVQFEAKVMTNYYNWEGLLKTTDNWNNLSIQVTDLGVTARVGINKSVVMIRSLKTGKPVADATVNLLSNINSYSGDPLDKSIASAKSDKNGLAVITYTEEQLKQIEAASPGYSTGLYLFVQNGKDKVVFAPDNHSAWREGVFTSRITEARRAKQQTFMFVDRGLYKPGEIVTFRGIDKNQLLGTLVSNHGSYTIISRGNWWKSDSILEKPITGTLSENGGFYGSFKIPDDTPGGSYIIEYKRNENSFNETATVAFTVASFERAKFESSVTIPSQNYYGGEPLAAELSANYLAGGALSNAAYKVSWYKQAQSFRPDTKVSKKYRFGPNEYYDSGRDYINSEEGSLDSSGKATAICRTEKIKNGRPYSYRAEAYITDVSNQRLFAQTQVTVHPSLFYFGIAKPRNISGYPKKKTKLEFPYIITDTKGELVNSKELKNVVKELKYSLSREEWSLVNEKGVDNSIYTRYEKTDIVEANGSITFQNSGILNITPKECGWYTLTITGSDINDNYVITTYEFYVTGGRSFWWDSYNSASIKLTPEQSEYNPGDTAEILLESPLPEGDYLITVEREGIFTEEIQHFDSPANVIKVPIANNYVPVVYVSVSSYSMRKGPPTHEYGETDLDKPKGYYGVTPVHVNPYVRAFSIKIEPDKSSYKPGETAKVKLTATKGGKPVKDAEITFMAVDRGVLDLINYHVPNPINFFYSKYNFPLCVKGGDSRNLLMDPVTYSVKNLQGGDSDEDEEKENERKDFRPTAVFEPSLMTDKNGVVTCTFKMPDTLTTYRFTAFGVTNDKFALQEDEVKVQNPVNVQQVQPRKLRVRDTAECGVLITNLTNNGVNVTVSAEVHTPDKDTTQDIQEGRKTVPGKGYIDGPSKHTVYVASQESSVVYFDVAATQEGTVELIYNIKSDVINEKLISPINIEESYVYETVTLSGQTDKKNKTSKTENVLIPDFTKNGRGDFNITLDATRLGMLGPTAKYLFEYPYGCMEQQSARVLPLMIFGEYIDVFGLDSKVSDYRECVKSFLKKWKSVQKKDGGFPYWPSGEKSDYYVSTRIAEIYAYGKQRGYTKGELKIDIDKLKDYLVNNFTKLDLKDFNRKAYALYVLNLLGDKRLNAYLDSMASVSDEFSLSTSAYIGLALCAEHSNESIAKAQKIADAIRPYLIPTERSVTISDKLTRRYQWYWWDNKEDENALILQLFVSLNPQDTMVDKLLYSLLASQRNGYWYNTASSSKALQAIFIYIRKRNLDSVNFTAKATVNGKQVLTNSFKGAGAKPKSLKLPFEDEIIQSAQKNSPLPMKFEKDGTGVLYYTVEMKYAIPDEMQRWRSEGIDVDYTITDLNTGDVINKDGSDAKNSLITLESGKVYKAQIYVSSKRNLEYLAVRCPIPSGAEILDTQLSSGGSEGIDDWEQENNYWRRYSNKDYKDNEAQFFFNWFYHGGSYITFTFRTSRRGVYPTPSVTAECMYQPEIFGRSNGYLFVIK